MANPPKPRPIQGLVEVGENVLNMFDVSGMALFLGGHLPVCRRGGMTGQRLGG